MQRNAFIKFILSIFLAHGVITSSSHAALFYSDYDCPGIYHNYCPGWYIGEYIGTALGHAKFKTTIGTGSYFTSTANIASVTKNGSQGLSPHDFKGRTMWGVQGGYNCIRRNFIYGLATDFGFLNLNGSNEASVLYPTFGAIYTIKTEINADWLWTARARLGMQLCPGWPFIYGTGGVALASIRVSHSFSDSAASLGHGYSTHKSAQLGWVAGGGIELPLCRRFTANGEYLFTKFTPISTNTTIRSAGDFVAGLSNPFKTKVNLSASIIRVGINYKF